jgi:hypothetical protein
MPDPLAPTSHLPKPDGFDHAIDRAVRDLQSAAKLIQKDSDDLVSGAAASLHDAAVSLAAAVQRKAGEAAHDLEHDVRAHPLAAAAAIAVAAAALAGLVAASLSHAPPRPMPGKPEPGKLEHGKLAHKS